MNSPTITMEKAQAIQKLEEYEEAARKRPDLVADIDRTLMLAYKSLAQGKRLIDVNDALRHGGLNLSGIPKLAIARANAASSTVKWFDHGAAKFFWNEKAVWDARFGSDRFCWTTPRGTFENNLLTNRREYRTFVPMIPLPLRPKHHLENYFILWEANWHPEPSRDPYLLRPIAGPLMEILAEWDLTPIEIAAVRASTEFRNLAEGRQ